MQVTIDKAKSLIHIVAKAATNEEMQASMSEVKKAFNSMSGRPFVVLVDLRGARAASPEVATGIKSLQEYGVGHGLHRSAHIMTNATTALQLNRISKESGAYDRVRRFATEAEAREWLFEDLGAQPKRARR